jgi:hypothetical protein
MEKKEKKTKQEKKTKEEEEQVEEEEEQEEEQVQTKKETPKKEVPNPKVSAAGSKGVSAAAPRTKKPITTETEDTPEPKETKKTSTIAPVLEPEKEAALKLILDEVNQRIKHFRNLGYATAHDGTLFLPKPSEAVQTGIKATILIEGSRFYLNVGASRQHNQLIKDLGGSWKQYRGAWEFLLLSTLPVVRNAFDITEETTSTKTPGEVYRSTILKPEHPKQITLIQMGDYIIIKGDTKPIKDELKAVIQMRWDGVKTQWTTSKANKSILNKTLDELVANKRLVSYAYEKYDEDEDDEE